MYNIRNANIVSDVTTSAKIVKSPGGRVSVKLYPRMQFGRLTMQVRQEDARKICVYTQHSDGEQSHDHCVRLGVIPHELYIMNANTNHGHTFAYL